MYFPTMPHDELFENTDVSKVGKKVYSKKRFILFLGFYVLLIECKNGHPFVVTEVSILLYYVVS